MIYKKIIIFIFLFFLFTNIPLKASDRFEELVELCNSCHSEENIHLDANVPNILGQHFFYIYTQLKDYKSLRRNHEIMSEISIDLTKDEMKILAKYFSEKKWISFKSKNDFAHDDKAERILYAAGRNSCNKCHEGFLGLNGVPRLAGQKSYYLNLTMIAYKKKTRLNAPTKNTILKDLADDEIKNISLYLSNFR